MNQEKPQLSEAEQKALELIVQQIREKAEKRQPIPIIRGAFGEIGGCEGIVEEFVDDGQGVKCKFFGCPLLYKGFPEKKSLESLGLVKALLTKFAEEVVWRSRFVQLFIVLYAVFCRRKFIHALRIFTYLTRVLVLNNLIYTNLTKFCYPIQHFLTVAKDTARKHWDIDPDGKMMMTEDRDYIGKRELPMVVLGILYIIAMII